MDLVQLEQQPRPGAPMLERISHWGTCHRRDPRHYRSHASTILRHTLSAALALPKVQDTLSTMRSRGKSARKHIANRQEVMGRK